MMWDFPLTLLTKAESLIDELLEPLEVMQNKRTLLKIALREVEEGSARPLNELIRELNLEGEI